MVNDATASFIFDPVKAKNSNGLSTAGAASVRRFACSNASVLLEGGAA